MLTYKRWLKEAMKDYKNGWSSRDAYKPPDRYDDDYYDKGHEKLSDLFNQPGDRKLSKKENTYKHVLKQKKEINYHLEDILPKEDGVIHRGMSHDEYHNILKHGKIQSKGKGNIGAVQNGLTYFTKDPASADAYANSFAQARHKPTPDKHAYVVSIKHPGPDREKKVEGTAEHEVGLTGHVDAKDIVAVHRGKVVDFSPPVQDRGFKRAAIARLHWEKIK